MLLLQIEDAVTATIAAQALVEEAHREIELSGIRPVLRLASLDAKIPLSMLRLPSDPSNPPEIPAGDADLQALTVDAHGLLNLRRPRTAMQAHRKVSWNSQQLAQVMSGVVQQKPGLLSAESTEAVAGSPEKDKDPLSSPEKDTDPLSLDGQPAADVESCSSATTTGRQSSRMVSPFAMPASSSSQS